MLIYTTMNQRGYVKLLFLFLLFIVFGFIAFPSFVRPVFRNNSIAGPHYCTPLDDPNAQSFLSEAWSYQAEEGGEIQLQGQTTYKMVKENIPMDKPHLDWNPPEFHTHPHPGGPITVRGFKFLLLYPNGRDGQSVKFLDEGSGTDEQSLPFVDFGLVYLVHLDRNGNPVEDPRFGADYYMVDIYKDINKHPLPDFVRNCNDKAIAHDPGYESNQLVGPTGVAGEYDPPQTPSPEKNQLQFQFFKFRDNRVLPLAWWIPQCKPAIYLYPKQKMLVNVQVVSKGYLTYTDPIYHEDGWRVLADTTGILLNLRSDNRDSNGKVNSPSGLFDYLYYEGKIPDNLIDKPTKGFVRTYEELATLYKELLPKLGLNEKESQEFMDYWEKALPKSPYYFVGIISQENVNQFEPLTIIPKYDTMIRVRLYFEALNHVITVEAPQIVTPERKGFTVVEWGGMVKRDKDHPFTCSQ